MCGIAGIVGNNSLGHFRGPVERMCAAMAHRGPDDGGVANFPNASLGMRRLAIFDPAHGRQPMTSPDGRFTIVFNGAIYNFRELRAKLGPTGWIFQTDCDTEVLLAAFVAWRETCLNRLRGMFAFAVWDNAERTLFLARDPFGIKPLYYCQSVSGFFFASELRALAASGLVATSVDPAGVGAVLAWSSVPAPRTIFRDCLALPAACCGSLSEGVFRQKRYWQLPPPAAADVAFDRQAFCAELRDQLADTTRAHSLADVPVGAFLSGGLDSAAVVALMTQQSHGRLKTFSIGFEEAVYSESGYAAETAKFFGTEHHPYTLTARQFGGDFEKMLAAFDQPSGDGVNTFYVSQAARAGGVTVALSGVGGDELFGGYPSFRDVPRRARALQLWGLLPGFLRAEVLKRLRLGDTRRRKLADLLSSAKDFAEVLSLQRRLFSAGDVAEILSPDARAAGTTPSILHPAQDLFHSSVLQQAPLAQISAWELTTYMEDVLLRDSDAMSMWHSLELRVPFVDRPLVEWLWSQPEAFRSAQPPKALLYSALHDLLPPGLALRKKRGFTLPLAQWMRRELRPQLDEIFSDASLRRSGLFSPSAAQLRWQTFLAQDDAREWSRLWTLAMLVAFVNRAEIGTRVKVVADECAQKQA